MHKHLSELEKYQHGATTIEEIEESRIIGNESGNDSGCENYSDRKSTDNDSSNHSRTRKSSNFVFSAILNLLVVTYEING